MTQDGGAPVAKASCLWPGPFDAYTVLAEQTHLQEFNPPAGSGDLDWNRNEQLDAGPVPGRPRLHNVGGGCRPYDFHLDEDALRLAGYFARAGTTPALVTAAGRLLLFVTDASEPLVRVLAYDKADLDECATGPERYLPCGSFDKVTALAADDVMIASPVAALVGGQVLVVAAIGSPFAVLQVWRVGPDGQDLGLPPVFIDTTQLDADLPEIALLADAVAGTVDVFYRVQAVVPPNILVQELRVATLDAASGALLSDGPVLTPTGPLHSHVAPALARLADGTELLLTADAVHGARLYGRAPAEALFTELSGAFAAVAGPARTIYGRPALLVNTAVAPASLEVFLVDAAHRVWTGFALLSDPLPELRFRWTSLLLTAWAKFTSGGAGVAMLDGRMQIALVNDTNGELFHMPFGLSQLDTELVDTNDFALMDERGCANLRQAATGSAPPVCEPAAGGP
jgi:hypothetical protein